MVCLNFYFVLSVSNTSKTAKLVNMWFLMLLYNLACWLQYTVREDEQIAMSKNLRRHSPEESGIGNVISVISIVLYAAVLYGVFVIAR